MQTEQLTYSVDEACRVTGLGKTSLFGMMKSGQLDRVKIGRRTLIPAASLQALVRGNRG